MASDLFSRLLAWLGYRLIPLQELDEERRASARTIGALTEKLDRLLRVHTEDRARFGAKLDAVRTSLESTRTAEVRAREGMVRQAAEVRERIERNLWGKISGLRARLEAERRARQAAACEADALAAAQGDAHAQALGKLWERVVKARARVTAARKAEAKAREGAAELRQELQRFGQLVGTLSRELPRGSAMRADAEAMVASLGGGHTMSTAKALKARGRPDLAAATVCQSCDRSDPKVDVFYLQLLAATDDNQRLQQALRESIERLPDAVPRTQAAYLRELFDHAGLACLEPQMIELLLRKSERAAEGSRPIRAAREGLRSRLQFALALRADTEGHATLIPLGLNCMAWTLPNRWGLRRSEEFVSLFTPFAYGVHRIRGLQRALESDFNDYDRADQLIAVETKGGHQHPARKDALAFWNHNLGPYWLEDGFARFHEATAQKIEGFRAACRSDNAVFLMSRAPIDYPHGAVSFLDALNQALEPFTGRAKNRLLLWNEHADEAGRHIVDSWTQVLNCPYPTGGKSYIWYEGADTPQALAYERRCAQSVADGLQDWGLLRARKGRVQADDVAEPAVALG